MARINIEDSLYFDPRFKALSESLGNEWMAIGCLVKLWRLAQEQHKRGKLITNSQFKLAGFPEAIFECEFAKKTAEGIYVNGTERHLSWLRKRVESGRNGAKVTNAKRWGCKKSESNEINNIVSANGQQMSASSSNTKLNNNQNSFDLEFLYSLYPRKIGKKKGIEKLKTVIKSQEIYNKVKQAITEYRNYCTNQKIEATFIQHFSTFINNWEDWLDPQTGKCDIKQKEFDWNYVYTGVRSS